MSTSYAISSFIKLDDLKALTKVHGIDDVKINHKNDMGDIVNYVRDRAGNYLLFYLWDRKGAQIDTPDYITSFDRFGMNNPDLIIDIIEKHCEVELVDEHRDDGKTYELTSIHAFDLHQETIKEGK